MTDGLEINNNQRSVYTHTHIYGLRGIYGKSGAFREAFSHRSRGICTRTFACDVSIFRAFPCYLPNGFTNRGQVAGWSRRAIEWSYAVMLFFIALSFVSIHFRCAVFVQFVRSHNNDCSEFVWSLVYTIRKKNTCIYVYTAHHKLTYTNKYKYSSSEL